MLPTLLLSVTGGLLVWRAQSHRSPPLLIDRLMAQPAPQRTEPATKPSMVLTDEQNLALAVSLLGMTTVGHLGLPLLRWVSTPGLLYLDVYFIRMAYREWQVKRRLGIATNDAILATGLVVTRQLGAGSLFATLFFASRKLQALATQHLVHYLRLPAVTQDQLPSTTPMAESVTVAESSSAPSWYQEIDRGALPLLTLSIISVPLLGINRALAVLLTNFGYDYRITAPLSTLSYLKVATTQGLWLRDPHVLERLQQVDLLVLAVDWNEQQIAALQASTSLPILVRPDLPTALEPVAVIRQLQAQGHSVAYFTNLAADPAVAEAADLAIGVAQAAHPVQPSVVHIILPADQPLHLQQLLGLTHALAATQQRGFYLALAAGLLNLGGIYLGSFGVVTALLVDYGAGLIGILNATWPQLPDDLLSDTSVRAP